MRRVDATWVVMFALAIPIGAASARPVDRILRPAAVPAQATIMGEVERHDLRLDPLAIVVSPERLHFVLPDGGEVELERARFVSQGPGLVTWTGTVAAADPHDRQSSYARFSVRPSGVTGVLLLPDGRRFEIVQAADGGQQLVRVEADDGGVDPRAASCGAGYRRPTGMARIFSGMAAAFASGAVPDQLALTKDAVTIDVAVFYSDAFLASGTETQARNFAEDSIADANEIFWNTGIDAAYALVHVGPITGAQPPLSGIDDDLRWLNTQGSGATSELTALRQAHGADVVVLLVPLSDNGRNACGIANLPISNGRCDCIGQGTSSSFSGRAYSVVRAGCGLSDFTVAHEMGHNLGLWHDRVLQPRSDLLHSFAYGNEIQPGISATLMACTGFTQGEDIVPGVCNRIPYLSDPDLLVGSFFTGTVERDNARAAALEVGPTSLFMPPRTSGVPFVMITSPSRYALRPRTVSFIATATDPEQGSMNAAIRWRVDGVEQAGAAGPSFTHTFATAGAHLVTATVTDNTGRVGQWSLPIIADNPPVASFNASCSGRTCTFTNTSTDDGGVLGWAWELGSGGATSQNPNVTFTYPCAGTYTVRLTVRDARNQTSTTTRTVTITAAASVAWIQPAEASWGPPGTLTAAGHATNGCGGVRLFWRDATVGGGFTAVAWEPPPGADTTWSNTIPAPINKCHDYQAYVTYSGVTSSTATYSGLTSGFCTESARVIWVQPQPRAGFGPANHLIVAGEARNAPASYGVRLSYRNVTTNGAWTTLAFAPGPDASGIWYNAIPVTSYNHQYAVRVTYDVITSSTCTYAGANDITWC